MSLCFVYTPLSSNREESFTGESISEEEQDLTGTWKGVNLGLEKKSAGLKPLEAIEWLETRVSEKVKQIAPALAD